MYDQIFFIPDCQTLTKLESFRGHTHIRIKGQNLNFYLETHATSHNIHASPHNIYFTRLKILPRVLGTLCWRVDDPVDEKVFVKVMTNGLVEE